MQFLTSRSSAFGVIRWSEASGGGSEDMLAEITLAWLLFLRDAVRQRFAFEVLHDKSTVSWLRAQG